MMKKNPTNKFDKIVEAFALEFSKIPNFDLVNKDKEANQVFKTVTFRLAELTSYRDLVCSHFIPATNKAIFDGQQELKKSRYKHLISVNEDDFKETLYDTVRLAYVGLFHKLENYINDVIKLPELIFGDLFETDVTVAKWAKDKYKFDIKDWQQFYITYKINWICNCVKHKDGLPIKIPKPIDFEYLDETKRIKITPQEFRKDCDELLKFYPIYIRAIFLMAYQKLIMEKPLIESEWTFSPELYDKQLNDRLKAEDMIQNYLSLLKQMA
jgi:hypothetical protein